MLLRQFLASAPVSRPGAAGRWIASKQREDGTWANFYGGPGDLSTTVEAYVALRLAGHEPAAPHMARAAGGSGSRGGIPATRVFTRIWLAMFGEWSWDDLPVMPPELIYLPAWFPLNVYDWACWARQTIVPLTIVGTLRPVRPLPFTLNELPGPAHDGPGDPPRKPAQAADRTGWAARLRRAGPRAARLRAARPRGPAGAGGAPRGAAPVRRVDHRAAGEGRLLGRHPAALGLLADRPASARLRARPPGDQARAGRAGPVHHLSRTPRTARCGGWRPASHRCGTPCWPSSRWPTRACRPIIPP